MPSFDVLPLQAAVQAVLTGDAALMNMVQGVYDYVPQSAGFPYVMWEDSYAKMWANTEAEGTEQLLTLHIYSRNAGRKEVADIMRRIQELLYHADISVDDHALLLLKARSCRVEREKDGITYKGILQLSALLRVGEAGS